MKSVGRDVKERVLAHCKVLFPCMRVTSEDSYENLRHEISSQRPCRQPSSGPLQYEAGVLIFAPCYQLWKHLMNLCTGVFSVPTAVGLLGSVVFLEVNILSYGAV